MNRSEDNQSSEEQLRRRPNLTSAERDQLFLLSLDMLCIASGDGYFNWLNPAFTEALGWTLDELLARPLVEFVHPDDQAATQSEIERQVTRGEKVLNFQNRYRHKDGSWRVLSWRSAPQGNLMYAVARDVTESARLERGLHEANAALEQLSEWQARQLQTESADRQLTERLLHSSEEKFRSLLAASPDALVIADQTGNIVFTSDQMETVFGYGSSEVVGKPLSTLIPERYRGGHASHLQRYLKGPTLRNMGAGVDLYGLHKDGGEFPVEISLSPTDTPDGLLVTALIRDVTQQKQSDAALRARERDLRLLISNIKDYGLYMVDLDGNVSSWNEGCQRIKGYSADEILGKDFACFYTEEDATAGLPRIALHAAAKHGRHEVEGCWRIRKDGSQYWASVIMYAIHDDSGVLTGFAKITRDLTAQRLAEIENADMQKRLAQAQKMEAIGQLTGGVAHDFNNLLTIILGNADMLAEDIKDPELQGLAAMIRTAAERGTELTNSLLAFARRQPLEPQSVNANKLLVNMHKLLGRTLGEQIEIEFVQAAGLWNTLVDPAQLESALLNLAINARDAMPGGGRLTIETGNASVDESYSAEYDEIAPGQYVLICLSDTGTGMSPEVAERAFEPFFTTKEIGKGTGLGLSMVYGFVKQSGGHIKIYSEVGQGTTFKIYVPRSMQNNALEEATITATLDDPAGAETILMVEDDELVREHVERLLRSLGYRVLIARDGLEAMQVLERGDHIDLLFTDVVMPGGMGGRQLADKVTALRPSLPILFTSGYTQNAIVHHGRLDAGVHLLKKPYRRRDLALKLRQLLDPALHDKRLAGDT